MSSLRLTAVGLACALCLAPMAAAQPARRTRAAAGDPQMAARVRAEFLHAWRGYRRYAWGHDELRPLTKTYRDWYEQPLYMTPVDALDTMLLMGLTREAAETRAFVVAHLSFDRDVQVQVFEITIRHLGALLACYQLTGDRRLLALAEDLGTRLLPAFASPTGLPYRFVNLKTGQVRDAETNPAEAGTLLVEFGTLSKLTRKPVFYEKAKRALVEVYKRRAPATGLVGSRINVETGAWTNTSSHLSGGIDSYYEYLLKCWLLFGDEDCRRMWRESVAAAHKYLADEAGGELWYGRADMRDGRRTATTFGALDAFFPAVLVLDGDLARARRLQAASFKMWRAHGIEPERWDYRTEEIKLPSYPLRPEIVESAYYLHSFTRDPQYRRMGATMFADFVRHCRTEEGYAALKSVVTKEQEDNMESFLFAETFKYFYLLYAPPATLDPRRVVFNTEAHPIRRTW